MPDVKNLLIRHATISEQKELEDLQLRASLTNPGDRDALLAYPDAIELPLTQITAGAVFVAEWRERLSDLPPWNLEQMEKANSMRYLSTQTCDVVELHGR